MVLEVIFDEWIFFFSKRCWDDCWFCCLCIDCWVGVGDVFCGMGVGKMVFCCVGRFSVGNYFVWFVRNFGGVVYLFWFFAAAVDVFGWFYY